MVKNKGNYTGWNLIKQIRELTNTMENWGGWKLAMGGLMAAKLYRGFRAPAELGYSKPIYDPGHCNI
jgi:hypothetical protein